MMFAEKRQRFDNKDKRQALTGWLFAMPAILGFLIFTLVPMIVSFIWGMTDYSVFKSEMHFIGLDNFRQMFSDADLYFFDSIRATAVYTVLNVPASLLVSFLVALVLNTNIRFRGVFRSIFYLPSIIPQVATCIVWLWLLNPQYGLINNIIKSLGMPAPGWLWDKNSVVPTIVLIGLWNTGGTMVIFLAGLQGIPKMYYEALVVDGGNGWHKLIHITLPLLTPTIFFNGVMAIIGSLQVFTQGYVMTQGGPNNASLFYVYYLFKQAFEKANMGYACALAWFLFVIILILTMIVMRSQKKWVYYGGE